MRQLGIFFSTLSIAITTNIFSQVNLQKDLAVTVYNDNLAVIKDIRELDLKKGMNNVKITDVAQLIDPTSVHIDFDGNVIEQNYQYDLASFNKILNKYIDKKIQLVGENNELIEGTLLSSSGSNIVLMQKDGGLIMIPKIDKYRFSVASLPEGLITKPTLVWELDSFNSGRNNAKISYQTRGMNWHAEYVAVLNENDTKLDLNSWVSIENNSGTSYKNAKLKLVAGNVNRVKDKQYFNRGRDDVSMIMKESASPQFEEKSFFEYHIYNLQRRTTLKQNETKQISLFEARNVDANKKYFYRSTGYNSNGKISVIVEFSNQEKDNLGVPMPKGKVRVYKSDNGSMEFIGEDLIDHTPKNEKIKLKIGDAFDILAEEKQTEHRKLTDRVYEQTYEIKLKNRKDDNVIVNVERYLGLNWEVLSSSIKYNKKDAFKIEFNVPVKKNSETTLTYKVRYNR